MQLVWLTEDIPFSSYDNKITGFKGREKGSKIKGTNISGNVRLNEQVEGPPTPSRENNPQQTQVSDDIEKGNKVQTDKGALLPSVVLSKVKNPDDLKNLDPEMLKTVQASLAEAGYDMTKSSVEGGGFDGKYGPETEAAFTEYMKSQTMSPVEQAASKEKQPVVEEEKRDWLMEGSDGITFQKGGFITKMRQYQNGGLV